MFRDIEEILSSQQTMLQRSGKDGANIDREKLGAIFRRQLTRVERTMAARANVQVLHVR